MANSIVVPRGAYSIEDPWAIPAACTPVRLRCATDGSAPRLATSLCLYFDDDQLTLVFSAADDLIVATHTEHDAPLYREDVVEAFLAPVTVTEYFELEVNPKGATFDARIDSPDGIRKTMRTDLAWTCEGLFAAVRTLPERSGGWTTDTLMRIPFAALGCEVPKAGEEWRANFFRIDRHPSLGDEFSAWIPSLQTPPDFHVTAAFGTLVFETAETR